MKLDDSYDEGVMCESLDISILFHSSKLKPGLREERDYTLVPEEAYKLLNRWHGEGTYPSETLVNSFFNSFFRTWWKAVR